jgi:hypothetical protein
MLDLRPILVIIKMMLIFFFFPFYQSTVSGQLCTHRRKSEFCFVVFSNAFGHHIHFVRHKQTYCEEQPISCDVCNKAE